MDTNHAVVSRFQPGLLMEDNVLTHSISNAFWWLRALVRTVWVLMARAGLSLQGQQDINSSFVWQRETNLENHQIIFLIETIFARLYTALVDCGWWPDTVNKLNSPLGLGNLGTAASFKARGLR